MMHLLTADLLALIEDEEMLLLMPLSPKHDVCEHKHQPAVEEVAEEKTGKSV